MNRTWKENYSLKLKMKMEKHKFFKVPMMLWLFVVSFVYDICHCLSSNSKRIASIMATIIFFIMGSSFSFDVNADYEAQITGEKWAMIQENYEYVPTVLSAEVLNAVEDAKLSADSLDESELDDDYNVNYSDEEIIDAVSLDDIVVSESEPNSENDTDESDELTQEEALALLTKDDWQLILVNKQHPIPDGYEFTPAVIKGSMKCDSRILADLVDMMKAANDDGISLVVSSSYRDYDRQTYVFKRKVSSYIDKGYSYLDAYKLASITVTIPDASEHQIGLALDITCTTYSQLEIEFANTKAGKWLAANCQDYGFILRYPEGKEDITGIQYEPWHFRYVGKTAATEIMSKQITLEEFVAQLD